MNFKYWKEYLYDNLMYTPYYLLIIVPGWIWWALNGYSKDSCGLTIMIIGCLGLLFQWIGTYFIDKKYVGFDFDNTSERWYEKRIASDFVREKIEYEKEYNLDYAFSQLATDPV